MAAPGPRTTCESESYLATKQPITGGIGSAEDVAEAAPLSLRAGLAVSSPAQSWVVDGGWSVREGEASSEPTQSS